MYISNAILTTFLVGTSIVSAAKMKYKVISNVSNNQTAGVMVDDQVYPLTVQDESTLYFVGKAPVADNYYKYVILDSDKSTIIEQENFTRTPVTDGNTLNEYYNRTWNSMDLVQLPTILDPLSIIDRIDSDLHIDGQIPTFHITGNQSALDYIHSNANEDIDIQMNMTYISLNDVKTFTNITLAVSGHSTRTASKPSYKIKIQKDDSTLYEYRRIKLRAMSTDATYMREEIVYDIANKIGMLTSKYSYARLYLNDQPVGLFGLAEVFKNPWIRNEFAGGDKDFVQGALFAADVSGAMSSGGGLNNNSTQNGGLVSNTMPGGNSTTMPDGNSTMSHDPPGGGGFTMGSDSDLSYLGDNATLYETPYPAKEDPSTGSANYTRIMELTKFISQQPNATMVNNSATTSWERMMDVESFIRYLALDLVISNSDGYLNMANNYLMYDDLDNDRLVFGGQDYDLTMGTTMGDSESSMSGNYTQFSGFTTRPLTTTLFKVPQYKERLETLIYNITKSVMNPDILNPRIDAIASMILEDVEWDKTCTRLGNSSTNDNRGPSSSSSNVPFVFAINGTSTDNTTSEYTSQNYTYLKKFVQERSTNIVTFFDENIYNNSTNTTSSS